jgi:hypothetical protein
MLVVLPCTALVSCAMLVGVDFDRVALPPDGGEDGRDASSSEGGVDGSGTFDGGGSCPGEAVSCAGKCGTFLDPCGFHACADCPPGQACGAAGPNVCGVGTCVPDCRGKSCGQSDGCSSGCDGPCPSGLRCTKNGCLCDTSSCAGCCEGDILGTCRSGAEQNACGTGGATCAACTVDRPCTGGNCTKTPHFVSCEQVAPAGLCASVCTGRGLTCSSSCPNPITHTGTLAGLAYEDGLCGTTGGITGLLACSDAFPTGTQSASCCCQ